MSSIFYCTHCGRAIFRSEDILERANLWDLHDYQANAYLISRPIDEAGLRRYDTSLHQGWYCCRFIMMRMLEDKFGTGDKLVVYADSVVELPVGETPKISTEHPAQISLNLADYDAVTLTSGDAMLRVVKIGGIWCPPCRLMDSVIERIVTEKILEHVEFFEVDIDKEQELAARFQTDSIPYLLFYYGGKQLQLTSKILSTLNGGILGGHQKDGFIALLKKIQQGVLTGATEIEI